MNPCFPITKNIEQQLLPGERPQSTISTQANVTRIPLCLIMFFMIWGMEVYYRNHIESADNTFHLLGPCTWIAGLILATAIYEQRGLFKSVRRFHQWARRSGGKITETLVLDEQCLTYQVQGFSQTSLNWNSLASFKTGKKELRMLIGGTSLSIPLSLFSSEETRLILDLLQRKLATRNLPPPPPLA